MVAQSGQGVVQGGREIPRGGDDSWAWAAFVSATQSDAFCRHWLELLCRRLAGVRGAAVLVESVEARSFVPIAVWPRATPDLSRLSAAVEQALRDMRGVIQSGAPEDAGATYLAYPVQVNGVVMAVVALDVLGQGDAVAKMLREVHWGSAWLANMLGDRELRLATEGRARMASVLEMLAVALRHGKFQQALIEVTSELRRHFDASRVAIGLVKHAHVRLTAISEAATFERNTPLGKAYVRAMEETFDHGAAVTASYPAQEADPLADAPAANACHRELLAISGAAQVISIPLMQTAQCLGVVIIERQEDVPFKDPELKWLDAFAAMMAPVIAQRLLAERSLLARLADHVHDGLNRLFGPRHLVWKAGASALVVASVLLAVIPIHYRVTAKTVIEGEIQRVAAAPFEGFVAAAFVRAGDTVRAGQALARLDDRELRIEEAKWSSERDQYDNKLREAMANHDLTSVRVVEAQLRESEAQLKLVTDKIARARLTAPFDGLVVSGDLSQQIGAPVEQGKKLFEIAPLHSYRVILQVDERDIRAVHPGQPGRLVITGIAGETMPLRVAKVTPVATAQDGKNFFRVEAALGSGDPRLRPGMEGVAKIAVGTRSLWWVLTHSFTDWLRLTLWTWMP